MGNNIQYLANKLAGNCIFINDKYKLLLISPQKCGSTSILKALYDQLVETSKEYEKIFSHEYTKELCIHSHLKSIQDCSPLNLKRIFSDQDYCKILVTRDPIDRLCSAICSKYLIESTPFYQREIKSKRASETPLSQPYIKAEDFLNDFNEIAHILLTKGSIFGNEKASHASPISEVVPKDILPFFDHIIDITKREGWTKLKESVNQHLSKHPEHPAIQDFPHINENPLNKSRRFLSNQNLIIAFKRYAADYENLEIDLLQPDQHQQVQPVDAELKALNMFLSLANRSADLFISGTKIIERTTEDKESTIDKLESTIEAAKNEYQSKLNAFHDSYQEELNSIQAKHQSKSALLEKAHQEQLKKIKNEHKSELAIQSEKHAKQSSDLRIKNEQLIYFEELSRKTAEHLLIESHQLKTLNRDHDSCNTTDSQLATYFPFYKETKELQSPDLARRAEKRIKNKNFRSAKELLIQAYCMDKSNQHLLLRAYAVSIKNPIFRYLFLCMTNHSQSKYIRLNGVNQ